MTVALPTKDGAVTETGLQSRTQRPQAPERELPTEVLGIDFSGAKDAGRRIWVTTARAGSTPERSATLQVVDCEPARDLPRGETALHAALQAVRARIAAAPPGSFVGMDFPFGLPANLVRASSWEEFLGRFPLRFSDAKAFQSQCTDEAGRELRRVTDDVARTPFSPYNLWIYKQTYYGIREVLSPLVRDSLATVAPMQPYNASKPCLMEVCPASTLKRIGSYDPYKGKGTEKRRVREEILARLAECNVVVPETLRARIVENRGGDALDSVIAALGALRGYTEMREGSQSLPAGAALEGWVYF